jgi:hypothetical protein
VFLIAQPTIAKNGQLPDLTPLAEFGDVTVVVEAGEYPSFKPGETWDRVAARLADFDAELDYVTWAGGDTLAAVMVGAALAQRGHRMFRWLRFERRNLPNGGRDNSRGHYNPVEVQLL